MRADPSKPTAHLNLRWTMRDIAEIEGLARRGHSAKEIAVLMLSDEDEIRAVVRRSKLPVILR